MKGLASRPVRGGARRSATGDLGRRVVSALVLVVLALGATWLGDLAFVIFCGLLAGAIYYEWARMTLLPGAKPLAYAGGVVLAVLLAMLALDVPARALLAFLAISLAAALLSGIVCRGAAWMACGLAYAGLAAISLILLRGAQESGLVAIVFLFAIVWASDIFAYFAGRAIGGPKLAPAISPGKTWSGAVGGAMAGMVAGIAVWGLFFGPTSLFGVAILALVLSVASQLGDLGESALKRRFSVKDSGRIIPGHGGVMDRVDGLVAAAVLLYATGAASGGLDTPSALLFIPRN